MHHREGTLFTSTTINNTDDRHVFTAEDGFNLAIAVYDGLMPDFSDPFGRELNEYIIVEASRFYYDFSTSPPEYGEIPLELHPCTEEELGFNTDNRANAKFYEVTDNWKSLAG